MLVISVRHGETTTILTPSGETLSIMMLDRSNQNGQSSLGISVPGQYKVIRDELREQLLCELDEMPIFQVKGRDGPQVLIIASEPQIALSHYQQRFPRTQDVTAQLLENTLEQPWYPNLETDWLQGRKPPFIINTE